MSDGTCVRRTSGNVLRFEKRTISASAVRYAHSISFPQPELVDKLIVVDISPIARRIRDPLFTGVLDILTVMQLVQFDSTKSLSDVRNDVDQQLAKFLKDETFRAFLLTNLVKKNDKVYGWRLNVPALIADYHKIISFPFVNGLMYRGPTLFVKGELSNFIL